ncbi:MULTISPECIES: NAD-dependent epimerase/dehydratase family protein [unclassified Curtobacterium]|uniref:NAD-dependent epimerase/dehydratase family protein n=1 Tax=unclassified Curtobacterium TaxID=257496 RepID=UPI001AE2C5D0|nr:MULTISPECIES: NAD-dependent epimerase/dehydratase family protein [unclassified Curtobacterium]MBP1302714.1 nucleoside-diphosphate-sugar epimerase [Curtobacterium sp. 1310]MDT0211978.1 NAD-dependent epimerase/dehydratase family protein [Curtobacterium sp. BRD11]
MHVFVTGASGWIGSHTVDDLLAAGHDVTGLARSDAAAAALETKGVTVLRGDLDDLGALARGAAGAEGVLHLANKHDWSDQAATNATERAAVETLANALVGTDRPFVVASGVAALAPGRPAEERDPSPFTGVDSPRGGSENRALDFVDQGVRTIAARFSPTTHGVGDHGFVAYLTSVALERGVSGHVGDGSNCWAAVHVSDAARMVRLGLEQAPAGARLHAVAEEGIPTRDIAAAIGDALGLPVTSIDPSDASAHFGFIGGFFGAEMSASSTATQELLGWEPVGPSLLEDIAAGAYAHAAAR